ncbi:MAG: hypothetical protein AAFP89_14660 [Bacteroidota bacterium]
MTHSKRIIALYHLHYILPCDGIGIDSSIFVAVLEDHTDISQMVHQVVLVVKLRSIPSGSALGVLKLDELLVYLGGVAVSVFILVGTYVVGDLGDGAGV